MISHRFLQFVAASTAAIILGTFAYAQSAPRPSSQQTAVARVDQQWEYIIVCFGKTAFEDPQKTLAYRTLGVSGGNEGAALEANLDIMGRFGWEVAAIVGAIGGDQQIVLKRKYDKLRSANEYGLITQGRELYLKDLADIAQRTSRLLEEYRLQAEAEKNKPRLIDLDAVDEQAARQRKLEGLEKSYSERLRKLDMAPTSTVAVKYRSPFSNDIQVEIRSDLTSKFLKDGNSYRRLEVYSYLKSQTGQYRFKDPALDKYEAVKITATGFIRFSGQEVEVGSYSTSMPFGDRWTDDY